MGLAPPLRAPPQSALHSRSVRAVDLLGWGLALLGSVPIVLQIRHTLRSGTAVGVSPATQLAWLCSWVCWLGYALTIRAWPIVLETSLGVVLELVALGCLRRAGLTSDLRALGWLGGLALIGVSGLTLGPDAAAVAITVFDVAGIAPQTLAALRGGSLAGVSSASWVVTLASALGWLVYALAIGHLWAASWPLTAAIAATVILVAQRRAADPRTDGLVGIEPLDIVEVA